MQSTWPPDPTMVTLFMAWLSDVLGYNSQQSSEYCVWSEPPLDNNTLWCRLISAIERHGTVPSCHASSRQPLSTDKRANYARLGKKYQLTGDYDELITNTRVGFVITPKTEQVFSHNDWNSIIFLSHLPTFTARNDNAMKPRDKKSAKLKWYTFQSGDNRRNKHGPQQ